MARLSGLPSEHHHEGPGDAPRRRRGRPARTQATASDNAIQGKRVLSPTAESSQTKRIRRVQVDNCEDQIAEEVAGEVKESVSHSQYGDTIHVETQASATMTRRNRRHSEPVVTAQDEEDDEDELASNTLATTQPLSGLTPHLDRLGATRNRFINTRRARMSMPAQLHVERVDDHQGNRFQFMPIQAVLNGRTRRSLRRNHVSEEMNAVEAKKQEHKKQLLELHRQLRARDETIKDLEFKLETRRLGNIDVTEYDQELEQRLELARKEIDDLRASSLYMGNDTLDTAGDVSEDDDENNQIELVNSDDLHMSQDLDLVPTPHGQFASRVIELSNQVTFEQLPEIAQLTHDTLVEDDEPTLPDSIHDQAVQRYELELQEYTRALAEAQGALRVVTIELQNLNFVEPGAASDEILTELRHGLEILRQRIEKYFPGVCTGLTGAQMLRKIPELFGGIFFELREKTVQVESSRKVEVLLRRQYEGVLDLLGEAEEKVRDKDSKIYHLDKSNDDKQRTILDLEERVATLTSLAQGQDTELQEQTAQVQHLQDQIENKDTTLNELRSALETYRQDLNNVTLAATKFEEDHHETITKLEKEHALIVQELENELEAEQASREAAEEDAQQRAEYIDELEGRIARMESDVVTITTEMATLRERLDIEIEGRAIAETERDEQIAVVYQHANTIENLNETIVDLNEQIALLRTNLKAEQTQREKTEADLEETNNKIDDLNLRIHDLGIQGNELRSKLFQVQQEKELAIIQIQEEAAEREEHLNEQLATETGLHETAEKTIIKLTKQITKLQSDLANLDVALVNTTADRDELVQDRDTKIATLDAQLADMRAKYAALENSTDSTITTLEANITDLNHQIQRKDAEIKNLAERVIEQERIYLEDTNALKENVAGLESDLAAERAENEDLRKKNASLSERLAETANELLNVVSENNEQKQILKSAIADHEATIIQLQAAAAERAAGYEDQLTERAREIEQLQLLGEEHVSTIISLNTQIEDLKETFRVEEEYNRRSIDALMETQRQLQEQNKQLAEDIKRRGADVLRSVQNVKTQGFEVKTTGLNLHRAVTGRVSKVSDKVKIAKKGSKKKVSRRQYDSGFGIDPEIEDATEGAEPNVDEFIAV